MQTTPPVIDPYRLPKRRNIFLVWFLWPLLTFGIYQLVWYYKINKEAGRVSGEDVSPITSLIAITIGGFLIIPPFISVYNTGVRISRAQAAAGRAPVCNGVIGIVLMFVLNLWTMYYQAELNGIVDAHTGRA